MLSAALLPFALSSVFVRHCDPKVPWQMHNLISWETLKCSTEWHNCRHVLCRDSFTCHDYSIMTSEPMRHVHCPAVARFLLGDLDGCVDLLVESGRIPEAAFFARTYLPSRISEVCPRSYAWLGQVTEGARRIARHLVHAWRTRQACVRGTGAI